MKNKNIKNYSGMDFYINKAYLIEDSPVRPHGIRSVEFVRSRDTDDGAELRLIEAKETIANPNNSPESYKNEINEICEKFIHSLNLLSAVKLGVVSDALPKSFAKRARAGLTFILVVRTFESQWCKPVKREIERSLPEYFIKIWRPKIFVINHKVAIRRGIAISC